jgi:hypothetical protein
MKTANNLTTNFSTTQLFDESPAEVFAAVNNVTAWWTENLEGSTQKLNDEFEVGFEDVHYSKQRLTAIVPEKKVTWLVTDSRLSFVENKSEWTGTKIHFEIDRQDDKTRLRFTHIGLVPQGECYNACSGAWTDYISTSLRNLITTGKGNPDPKASPLTSAKN